MLLVLRCLVFPTIAWREGALDKTTVVLRSCELSSAWEQMDFFVLSHFFGWFVVGVATRCPAFSYALSAADEIAEWFFFPIVPQLQECWHDTWIFDLLGANLLGCFLAYVVLQKTGLGLLEQSLDERACRVLYFLEPVYVVYRFLIVYASKNPIAIATTEIVYAVALWFFGVEMHCAQDRKTLWSRWRWRLWVVGYHVYMAVQVLPLSAHLRRAAGEIGLSGLAKASILLGVALPAFRWCVVNWLFLRPGKPMSPPPTTTLPNGLKKSR